MRILLLFTVALAFACKGNKSESTTEILGEMYTIEIKIDGMTCSGCESTIQTNVSELEGINNIKASHSEGNAVVSYDPEKIDSLKIKEKIVASGYNVLSIATGN